MNWVLTVPCDAARGAPDLRAASLPSLENDVTLAGWHNSWPDTRYPAMWKVDEKPERFYKVELECHCADVEFPEPAPPVGSVIWCRAHGAVRVAASTRV